MSFNEEWEEVKLGELCEVKGGKRLPKEHNLVEYETKHPYVRVRDFENIRINKSNLNYIKENTFEQISKYIINEDNLYISIAGTIGKVGKIGRELDGANLTENAAKIKVNNKNKIIPDFLMYYLLSSKGQNEINIRTVGSTQKKLALYRIKQIPIVLPDLNHQREIINILSNLDKKIENNNKMNKTLEEMAQAIYKNWFIDFEPFKNESFDKGKIKEIIEITLGNSPKSDTYNEDGKGLPLLNGASDFNNGRPTSGRYSSKPKRIAKKGEILLCTRGTIGHVSFADKDYCIGRGVSSMKPQDKIYNEYIYFTVKYYLEKLKREAAGSVIRGLTKSDMLNIPIVKCDKNIFEEFHDLIKPIINKQLTIIEENKTLKELRDTLLPKLMSGELNLLSKN